MMLKWYYVEHVLMVYLFERHDKLVVEPILEVCGRFSLLAVVEKE